MTKRLLSIALAMMFVAASLCGCEIPENLMSGNASQKAMLSTAAVPNPFFGLIEDDSDSDYDVSSYSTSSVSSSKEPEQIEEAVMMRYSMATAFSEGVAWALSADKYTWSIIDTQGNIVKTFEDGIDRVIFNFINGYSAVSVDNSFMIVNTKGEVVLDGKKLGYNELYSYDGIKEGSVIAIKNIDEFDKSGDYYYHYDLNTNTEIELGAARDDNFHYYFYYAGKGYYVITNNDNGQTYNNSKLSMNIVFTNYMKDTSFDLTENKVVKETLASAKNPTIDSWRVTRVGDYVGLSISPYSGYDVGFKVDLDNKKCAAIKELNGHKVSEYSTLEFRIDDVYGNIATIDAGSEIFYYDFAKDKATKFAPKTDYECSFKAIEKERTLVTTRNSNSTLFYTVVGWDMKPLFSPKKYSDSDVLTDDYMISEDEEEGVIITNVADSNKEIKKVSDASIHYVDKKNKCVWLEKSSSMECYDITTGDLKCTLKGNYKIENDMDSNMVLTNNTDSYDLEYYNMNGDKLEVQEDVVYKYVESSEKDAASEYDNVSIPSAYATTSSYGNDDYDIFGGTTSADYGDANAIANSIADELDDFDVYDFLSGLVDLAGSFGRIICIVTLVIGILGCFFGFKLTKIYLGICGFLAGGILGIVLAVAKDEAKFLLLGIVLAIVFAVLAYKLYKLGVFVMTFVNGFIVGFLVGAAIFKDTKKGVVVGIILGLITGIVSIIFVKPTIIISTSISFGDMAGVALGLLLGNSTMCRILPFVFMIAGAAVQIYSNGGLFEGKTQESIDRHMQS